MPNKLTAFDRLLKRKADVISPYFKLHRTSDGWFELVEDVRPSNFDIHDLFYSMSYICALILFSAEKTSFEVFSNDHFLAA